MHPVDRSLLVKATAVGVVRVLRETGDSPPELVVRVLREVGDSTPELNDPRASMLSTLVVLFAVVEGICLVASFNL